MFTPQESAWMQEALLLAEKGLYTTHPNPRVGCLIVKNGRGIGRGWHTRVGEPHAEVLAMQEAGEEARGGTGYVTLEPCAHFGHTPPCDEALISAGLSRVVASTLDPYWQVSGRGVKHLKQAGIQVDVGLLQEKARTLNKGYFKRHTQKVPWVTCKMAMSLDGRTALATGESKWLTGSEVKQAVMHLRAQSSAIITGVGTVLQDDPFLTVRGKETECQPLRVVVDSHLRSSEVAHIFSQPPTTLIATTSRDLKKTEAFQGRGVKVVRLPANSKGQVSCRSLLEYLATTQAVNEVLLEAGPTLAGSFLSERLIDEIVIFMAPKLLGNSAQGLFQLPFIQKLEEALPLQILHIKPVGYDWQIHVKPCYKNEVPPP
ncbi:MAG: bifunctional diaminohydroxyphosphoribosylaminopyrimidine deaminase/5-amino-6-(5-phosphoribosylamino)uracil reductase RibD [Gammaproteobacteria bacterium]|nr:bifunctional diaminohydroxyphosphoribosylaminopyrimidine deaminase/5-amino-6-(5-phosphoribosylamino)uracil reductase RibD [Gammaproteobacteria bacterium]